MKVSRQTDVIFTEVIHHGKLLLVDLQVYFLVRREVIFASLGIALFKSIFRRTDSETGENYFLTRLHPSREKLLSIR